MDKDKDLNELLLKAYRRERDGRLKIRILAMIFLYTDKRTLEETSKILRLDISTIQHYKSTFKRLGIKGLTSLHYEGRSSLLSSSQQSDLKAYLSSHPPLSSKEVCVYVEKTYGVIYRINSMTKLLKRMGFSYKKPAIIPGKADAQKQQEFLENILKPALSSSSDSTPVYFVDGVHPVHNVQKSYGWILKGHRKEIRANSGRQRMNINGALCFHSNEFIYREDDRINANSTLELFKQIESQHKGATKITVFLDNAKYNRASIVKEYLSSPSCKIKAVYLPTYSPNLNLIERFWRLMKKKVCYNQYYQSFAEFKQEIRAFFQKIPKIKREMETLLAPNFQIIGAN